MEGLCLIGSRPGSTEPPTSFNNTFKVETPKTPKARSSAARYQDRLFSGPDTQTFSGPELNTSSSALALSNFPPSKIIRSRSQSPGPHRRKNSSQPSTPKRGTPTSTPTYVDETLFGDRPTQPDFRAPWDDGKKTVMVKDATDYKLQQKLREQRERRAREGVSPGKRASPMVASHTMLKKSQRGPGKFKPSHVDELLFGRGAEGEGTSPGISWQTSPTPMGPQHDPLGTGRMSVSGSRAPSRAGRPPSPGRPPATPGSHRAGSPGARPGSSAGKRRGGGRHKPSYVDELLFGAPPVEADWPAPWEDVEADKKRGRPLLFDSKDYRVTVYHDDVKPPRTRSQSQPRPNSAESGGAKAPWR